MRATDFTRLVGCRFPLQQAGMGGVAGPELAGAVAQAGGLGMIGGVRLPADTLAAMLDDLRSRRVGAIGVNFLMPFLDRAAVEAAASRCRVVEFFYGDPDPALVKLVHAGGALACWQVGSIEEAVAAERAGCDLIAVQGTEAGGHVRGRVALLPLLCEVLDAVEVPVVAAGGIGSPRAAAAALAAGADAVRVGTLFVASAESVAHPFYKDALVAAGAGDTVLTEAFGANWPNAPHRVLRSCVEAAGRLSDGPVGESTIAGRRVEISRFTTPAPTVRTTGRIEAMALYAGESVGGLSCIRPAAEIVADLMDGAERLLGG